MIVTPLLLLMVQFQVQTGLDQLVQRHFQPLYGKNLALLTNCSAIDSRGKHLLDHLRDQKNVHLKVILAPEHGFEGQLDQENIPDSIDSETGIRIFSLYGKSKRPSQEMLRGVDLLLFDIQDIGVRFYTYQTSMLYAMQECSKLGISFMVLDRPNPIGGLKVLGPSLDRDRHSFTGSFPMPVIHGMTMGELAKMFNSELNLHLDLKVVPCVNWKRSMTFEQTGLPWINPSPNMRNLTQALLYPAIGLLERTNLSVGRGTDEPFELFGAPWIEPVSFARHLNKLKLKGLSFVPFYFSPESGPFQGERCGGVHIMLKDAAIMDPIATSYSIFLALRTTYKREFKPENYISLLANREAYGALCSKNHIPEIRRSETSYLKRFNKKRARYLIYE
ncbi:MAG: hypothetical protein CR997_01350 [Acidobacteria bacterium]|nr:MAG: hypothetical protein CR997_01350 [Acidobacteriota bacterium]